MSKKKKNEAATQFEPENKSSLHFNVTRVTPSEILIAGIH